MELWVFVTTGQAGSALGYSIPTVKKLMATGVVPGVLDKGRQVFPLDALQALQELPSAGLDALRGPEVAVLRADAPEQVDEADRAWIGFGARLTEGQLLDGLRGWWRCDPRRVAAAGVLPVTVAHFVVAVLTGLETWESDGTTGAYARYRFTGARLAGYVTDLTNPVNAIEIAPAHVDDRRLAGLLLGTRLPSHSGGPIAYVLTRPAAQSATTEEGE